MGHVDLVGVGEQGVHPPLLVARHAEAPVLDLQGQPGGDLLGAQQHLGVRGREHRGVLDQFGQQMDHIGDGVSAQCAVDRRNQFDPWVLLDLGDRRAQDLGHGDRIAPLPPGDGATEDGEILRVSADAGGEVVDVEEALEQIGVLDLVLQLVEQLDLAVDERLEPAGEVDEDFDLLVLPGVVGEPGRLHDRGHGDFLLAAEFLPEQFEGVAAGNDGLRGPPRGHGLAVAELFHHPLQFGLAVDAGAAKRQTAAEDGGGDAVGREIRGQHGGEGQRTGPAQPDPQFTGRPGSGGADGEDDRCGSAQHRGDGRQHRGAQELGADTRLGGRLGSARPGRGRVGTGTRPAVPSALSAFRSRFGCAKLRHQCPRYVAHQESAFPRWHLRFWSGSVHRSGRLARHELTVDRRAHTVVVHHAGATGSCRTCPPSVPLWYEPSH